MSIDWNNAWPASHGLRLDVIEAIEAFHDANEEHIAQISDWGAQLPIYLMPNERVLVVVAGYEQGTRTPRVCILTLTMQRLLLEKPGRKCIELGDVERVVAGPSPPLMRDSPIEIRYGGVARHFRLRGQDTARCFADRIAKAVETNRD